MGMVIVLHIKNNYFNDKNYNSSIVIGFKKFLFSTNLDAKLLSDILLADSSIITFKVVV